MHHKPGSAIADDEGSDKGDSSKLAMIVRRASRRIRVIRNVRSLNVG